MATIGDLAQEYYAAEKAWEKERTQLNSTIADLSDHIAMLTREINHYRHILNARLGDPDDF